MATITFGLARKHQSSPQRCYVPTSIYDEHTATDVVNCLPLDSFQPRPNTFDSCRRSTVAHGSKIVESRRQLWHMPTHNTQNAVTQNCSRRNQA